MCLTELDVRSFSLSLLACLVRRGPIPISTPRSIESTTEN